MIMKNEPSKMRPKTISKFKKISQENSKRRKQKKTLKNSILVCGAPSLNKKIKIKIIADPIHIVLCNMIIVVKYVLSKRKREILNDKLSRVINQCNIL